MHISEETPEQTATRLLDVIAKSEFEVFEGTYVFEEFPLDDFGTSASRDALALVRDSEVWSQLVPSTDTRKELFGVFGFHFESGADNSGFVGWLATHLKRELGTGLFVVCGQNSQRGGIFDYWGCPAELRGNVLKEITKLRGRSN